MRMNFAKVSPGNVGALLALKMHIDGSTIDAKLRALIETRVSQINSCAYCLDMHANEARALGESQQRLDCLPAWRETSFFTDRERAALAWAEAVTNVAQSYVPDEVFEEARSQFSETELFDLLMIVCMINSWNRLSIAFRNEPLTRHAHRAPVASAV